MEENDEIKVHKESCCAISDKAAYWIELVYKNEILKLLPLVKYVGVSFQQLGFVEEWQHKKIDEEYPFV